MEAFLANLVLSDARAYRIGRHVLFWTICTLFFGTIYGGLSISDDRRLVFDHVPYVGALIFLPQHIFLSYGIIYFLFPRYLLPGKYIYLVAGIVVLIFATAFLSVLISDTIVIPFQISKGERPWPGVTHRLLAGLRGSNTVAGFVAAIKLVKSWYFKKTENEILEKEKLKAELDVLKAQLQPHFLFNTLNNLYSLILQRSPEAPHVVVKLSELLRYILAESGQQKILLTRELALLRDYVALEQMRFGTRLDLTINMSGDFEKKMIAPLILLPFIENAFKHGVNEVLEHPWLSLDISIRENQLKFRLINGKLAASPHHAPHSTGIGLHNVRKRLELLYPNHHVLRTQDEAESFVINLQMDLETE